MTDSKQSGPRSSDSKQLGSRSTSTRTTGRVGTFFALALMAIGMTLLPSFVLAQQQRIIQGKIFGASDEPLAGAVVYLKDIKTLGVKSFISTQDGSYRFGQLADAADYEVWAEQGGRKSPTRGVSSFDQKKQYTINLKLSK